MHTIRSLIREFISDPRFQSAANVTFNVTPGDAPEWFSEDEEEAEQGAITPNKIDVTTPTGSVASPAGITTDIESSFVRDSAYRGSDADPDFETEKRSIPGVTFDAQVTSTAPVNRFLEVLRNRVPREIPIIVASVYRDASRQASAMLGVWRAGGDAQIRTVYTDTVEKAFMSVINSYRVMYTDKEIRNSPPPPGLLTALETMISGLRASGTAFHTGHMVGRGADLRITGMSRENAEVILDAANDLGASAQIEEHPYHLHITVPNQWSM